MKIRKKLLSILLVAAIVISLLPLQMLQVCIVLI